jgi:hypothetical protein
MTHVCYACSAENPDRAVFDEGARLRIPARFTGPPGNANGGIAAGLLLCPALHAARHDGAAPAAAAVTARLHRGLPVERDLAVDAAPGDAVGAGAPWSVTVRDGEDTLVSGTVTLAGGGGSPLPEERAATIDAMSRVPVPDRPPFWEETGEHPIRGCFSCGPDNPRGLHIYPRIVEDGVTAAPWEPQPAFDDGAGALARSVIASALDCSSGICMPARYQRELLTEDRFFLLGSLEVRFLRRAPVAARYRVVARALLREGRKFFGMSALFDDAGEAYAMAEATWIVAPITRSQAFGDGEKRERPIKQSSNQR